MAQQQFAPREAPPAFGGCFAHELTKRILDIQVQTSNCIVTGFPTRHHGRKGIGRPGPLLPL